MELPAPTGGLQRTGTGFVFTQAFLQQLATLAADATPVAGWLSSCDVFLFTNSLQPTGATVYTDLVKPTWTGWGVVEGMTFSVGLLSPTGVEWQAVSSAQWTVGADPDPQIAGWGLVNGTNLIGAELFDDPVTVVESEIIGFIPTVSTSPT